MARDDRNGAVRVVKHTVADRSEQGTTDAASTTSAEHHEV